MTSAGERLISSRHGLCAGHHPIRYGPVIPAGAVAVVDYWNWNWYQF
ncbi:hypothetical protein AADR41_11330 [Streptomyces sp. CLV115]